MKTFSSLVLFFTLISFLLSCHPENITPTTPVTSNQPDLSNVAPLKQGMFTGQGGHVASGTVKIYEQNSKYYVVFDPYSSQSGPDLKVYLSKDEEATDFIRVGRLLSTTGKQTYEVPGTPDLKQYPFVHIWCEKFSVEFARAPLQ